MRLKLIDLHPSLDKDHQSKFYAIRTFAMNLDEMRLAAEAGLDAVDALYKKYNIARNERASLIIDPNVDDATYDLTLGDGTKLRIKVHKNPDGTRDIYAIDQSEESEASEAMGVDAKCIWDTAHGKQKHAGGYCWIYKDEYKPKAKNIPITKIEAKVLNDDDIEAIRERNRKRLEEESKDSKYGDYWTAPKHWR